MLEARGKSHVRAGAEGDPWYLQAGHLDLEREAWAEAEMRRVDLREGESVDVPLAQVLGTRKYFGRVLMPGQIRWHNPTLDEDESMPVQGMAPEDQWISLGLNVALTVREDLVVPHND